MRVLKKHPLQPFLSSVDAMNCVPTKTVSAWQALLAPLPEFGEGTGVGSESDLFQHPHSSSSFGIFRGLV
jgi:hypothetical protein